LLLIIETNIIAASCEHTKLRYGTVIISRVLFCNEKWYFVFFWTTSVVLLTKIKILAVEIK